MVKVRRVGNSMTVTIPAEVVAELGLTEEMDMNVFVREDAVVVEPAVSRWERLVSRVQREAAEKGLTPADVDAEVAALRRERRIASESPAGQHACEE
jgi:antitoxin component of MazEF toxin-antitoxin module